MDEGQTLQVTRVELVSTTAANCRTPGSHSTTASPCCVQLKFMVLRTSLTQSYNIDANRHATVKLDPLSLPVEVKHLLVLVRGERGDMVEDQQEFKKH